MDRPDLRQLNGPRLRTVLFQSEVGPALVVVAQVLPEHTPQMPLVEDDHMVETFSPDRPDHPLDIWVLPGRPRGSKDRLDVQRSEGIGISISTPTIAPRRGATCVRCRFVLSSVLVAWRSSIETSPPPPNSPRIAVVPLTRILQASAVSDKVIMCKQGGIFNSIKNPASQHRFSNCRSANDNIDLDSLDLKQCFIYCFKHRWR